MLYYTHLWNFISMSEEFLQNLPTRKPFFKTALGIILFIILGLLGIVLLIFGGFFGYYLWAQKFGSPEIQKELSERFTPSFSRAPGLGSSRTTAIKDVAPFIRSYNPVLGSEAAPVTIVAFIDFECPYCQRSYPIFEQMLQKYGPTVRVVFKNFPIPSIHPNAMGASIGATCAHEQGKFWPYYDKIFTEKNVLPEYISTLGEQLQMDANRFTTCLQNETLNQQVLDDIQDGISLGVQGTPTYFVNQQKLEGVVDAPTWDATLLSEIQKK